MEYVFYNIPEECSNNGAEGRNTSEVVKSKMHPLQHLLVFQSRCNVTFIVT